MKIKKILAPLMAVSLMATAMPVVNVSAAENDPRVYVDITYENNEKIRADIIFENVPDCWAGDFHIDVGDGWNLTYNNNKINTSSEGCTTENTFVFVSPRSTNDFLLAFSSSTDQNFNGRFLSFYLEKNSNFNSKNAKINVVFENSGSFDDYLVDSNDNYIIL